MEVKQATTNKRSIYLRLLLGGVSILFILLAVFAAFSDAVLGFQALMGAFGTAMVASVIGACILVAVVVAAFYLIQDGVTLWKRMNGEEELQDDDEESPVLLNEAQKKIALEVAEKKRSSLGNFFWLNFREFWFTQAYQKRVYQWVNFFGRLVSLIAAFAAGGGAYLAVETVLNLFGVTAGLGVFIPCALAAAGLALAFISQDGFSLVKRLRSFGDALSKPRDQAIIQSIRDYFKAMTPRQWLMSAVTVVLVGIAALAVTGDAFLGVETLLNVMSLSSPQVVLALSISLAVVLGVIWIAQEGFSLSRMLHAAAEKPVDPGAGDADSAKPKAVLSPSAERALKAITLTLGCVAAFAIAGGAYLGLEVLFTSVGFTGAGMIAISATAAVVAGLGFLAQDGRVFLERARERILAFYADKKPVVTQQADLRVVGASAAKSRSPATPPGGAVPSDACSAVGGASAALEGAGSCEAVATVPVNPSDGAGRAGDHGDAAGGGENADGGESAGDNVPLLPAT